MLTTPDASLMRLLPLLALVLTLPTAAQTWSLDGMLAEMVPVLVDAAESDFAPLRGDVLDTQGPDTLWASTYRPTGPSGPLFSRTAMNVSIGQSMFWFTISGTDSTFVQRLFGTALGRFNAELGSVEGMEGLGWTLAVAENSNTRKVVQWIECADVGRVAEVVYTPKQEGAEISISVVRRGGQGCPAEE
jgi:hypothetical protein